ncbi:phosphonate metabolism transcriptional regulator PhnF [Roseospira navarrensis]|uniref:Phosphonate metabolism transcriptional regulator PhnF n=1 Tax=Roseospira navarrensis TaxID=140058 RepID=A0A7X1ZFZ1_9PROT|nr:phosphonate metabolism transcriptional regulator PhnF [Roseospira navarrensis]MQX37760.1 phosphonate metabolism transcriptional regulator PhnF [Roseospira navarrensis]
MGLMRRSGVALWRQVQLSLESQLSDGTLQPGDQLPTEAQLSARYGVNRHTVRRALAGLEERSLIRVEQGRGTFVQEPVLSYRISERTRFSANLRDQKRVPDRQVLEVTMDRAEGTAAASLGLSRGDALVVVRCVSDSDGHRITYSEHMFPAQRFPGIGEAVRDEGSVSAALCRFGVTDYRRKWSRLTARMPTGREAEVLEQPRSRPVLVSESLNVDLDGHPIEFGITRFNSDWVQVVVEPCAPELPTT